MWLTVGKDGGPLPPLFAGAFWTWRADPHLALRYSSKYDAIKKTMEIAQPTKVVRLSEARHAVRLGGNALV